MAGVHAGHLPLLTEAAPDVTEVTTDTYAAMTANLVPHLPALTAIVAMVEQLKRGDFGVLGRFRLVRLPLSLIGTDKVRYRTPILDWLHESVLSLRMADLTIEGLQRALQPHGMKLAFLCSCGVVIGRIEDVNAFVGCDIHQRMDRLRSGIDAAANPVETVETVADIPVLTMDLHASGAEARLLARIQELTEVASAAGHADYSWLDAELADFIEVAQPDAALANAA
jgi:hypothetical protein